MDFDEEYGKRIRRRPRYLLLLLLIIPIALLFLFLNKQSVAVVAEKLTSLEWRNETVKLEDVLRGRFYPKSFNGTFLDEKTLQYFSSNGDLITYDIPSGHKRVVVSAEMFVEKLHHKPYKCDFSPTKKYILISYDPQKVYRHSIYALFDVYDIDKGTFTPLTTSDLSEVNRRIQLVKWTETDSLVFVHGNDLYFKNSVYSDALRVTSDGGHLVYNGVADWVYEEELFSSNEAVWADKDSIAFVKFNDTLVDLIQFPVYGGFQYPVIEAIPYPKSGRNNPIATIHIHTNGITKQIQLPGDVPEDHYIASIKWTNSKLLIQLLNRFQNSSWVLLCDKNTFCDIIHKQELNWGWIDVQEIFPMGTEFVTIESTKQLTHSYHHIVQFDKNSVFKIITHGDYSVDKILSIHGNDIFYTANDNLYKHNGTINCITCHLKCKVNDVVVKGMYFVNTCLNLFEAVPVVTVGDIQSNHQTVLEANEKLKSSIATLQLPVVKKLSFSNDGYKINIRLLLPYDFDSARKYPLVVDVYGGPGTSKLSSRFQIDWGTSLVSSKNIIYASIDGRGSSRQSDDFMFSIYKQLGTLEVKDQIDAVKWLIKTQKYIDGDRTAIWGWSYGGFVTAMAMGTDIDNVFKCGISVAPVTNWAFYDSIYTERYMSLPQINTAAYNNSDVANYVENFKNKKYLLIHGNADDNVHYQQSMHLARALELADVLFMQQSYPDENHGLGSVRPHLYHTFERFLFQDCFATAQK